MPGPVTVATAPTSAGQATPLSVYAIFAVPPVTVIAPGTFAVAGFDLVLGEPDHLALAEQVQVALRPEARCPPESHLRCPTVASNLP